MKDFRFVLQDLNGAIVLTRWRSTDGRRKFPAALASVTSSHLTTLLECPREEKIKIKIKIKIKNKKIKIKKIMQCLIHRILEEQLHDTSAHPVCYTTNEGSIV